MSPSSHIPISAATIATNNTSPDRMPVYFLGIGGPNFLENPKHPAYSALEAIGREITTKVRPKAVVVFSAHWQGGPDKIEINVGENAGIIYDFYGFPPHYYEYKFPYRGSSEIADKVLGKLAATDIKVERVSRGLDHGVWVGFIVGTLGRIDGKKVLIHCSYSFSSDREPVTYTNRSSLAVR